MGAMRDLYIDIKNFQRMIKMKWGIALKFEIITREDFQHELDMEVYDILVLQGPLTRPELLVIKNKVARTTMFDCLRRLIVLKYVEEIPQLRKVRGRPKKLFYAVDEYGALLSEDRGKSSRKVSGVRQQDSRSPLLPVSRKGTE